MTKDMRNTADSDANDGANGSNSIFSEEGDTNASMLNLITSALDYCPFGIAIFNAANRLNFANGAYYRLLDLNPIEFPISTSFERLVTFMNDRGDAVDAHHNPNEVLAEQIRLVHSGNPHFFHRTLQNGRALTITGQPLADGGFVRTYFDLSIPAESSWELDARVRMLRRHIADLEATTCAREQQAA